MVTTETADLSLIPAVILCGGRGIRFQEETEIRPKPMIEVAGAPILVHIMNHYADFGFTRFVLALGYKADVIKAYFDEKRHGKKNWEVQCVDTGLDTLKGGRIKRVARFLDSDRFHLTYGDGVASVDLAALDRFHHQQGTLATLTAVRPPSRFGEVLIRESLVTSFSEKPQLGSGRINGGFFVLNRAFLDFLTDAEDCDLEFGTLPKLVDQKQLSAFRHDGFWQCMDSARDRDYLEKLCHGGARPWTITPRKAERD